MVAVRRGLQAVAAIVDLAIAAAIVAKAVAAFPRVIAIGVAFRFLPARSALKLDPIEAPARAQAQNGKGLAREQNFMQFGALASSCDGKGLT